MRLKHIIAGFALLVSSLLGIGGAQAHATLVSTHPANGTVLETSPERLQLQFNEPVSVTSVRLIDAAGHLRQDLSVDARGPFVQITPPTSLPQGTQTLSYRIVSADGHPVGGVLTFSVGVAGMANQAGSVGAGREQAIWLLRVVCYLCLLGGVGAAVFRAWVSSAWTTRPPLILLAAGFVLLLVSVGVQGLDLLDLGWRALLTLEPWEAALATSYGLMAEFGAAATLLAAASLSEVRPTRVRVQTTAALLLTGAAFAATGHASNAPPQWLMRPAVFLHVVAACLWAGALAPLLILSFGAPDRGLPALKRFSALGVWAVALLALAGTVLAAVQVERPSALLDTPYGRILTAKLAVVALLLGLAALNRWRLVPALERGSPLAAGRLRWSLGGEVALMVVLAGLVAGWRFTPPPRSLVEELPPMIHLHGERLMVMVTLDPGRVGSNKARLEVLDASYAPFDPREITLTLSPSDGSLEPLDIQAKRDSEGTWRIDTFYVPTAGTWTVKIGALVNDFERVDLASEYAFNR